MDVEIFLRERRKHGMVFRWVCKAESVVAVQGTEKIGCRCEHEREIGGIGVDCRGKRSRGAARIGVIENANTRDGEKCWRLGYDVGLGVRASQGARGQVTVVTRGENSPVERRRDVHRWDLFDATTPGNES